MFSIHAVFQRYKICKAPYVVRPIKLLLALPLVAALSSCSFTRTILNDDVPLEKRMPQFREVRVFFVRERHGALGMEPVVRRVSSKTAIQDCVHELLRGPNPNEESTGVSTEIPRGTILIGVTETPDEVDLNISQRFASGGAGSSLETRLDQLKNTVAECAGTRKVFLDIEGKRLTATAGDGLEIKQPINM